MGNSVSRVTRYRIVFALSGGSPLLLMTHLGMLQGNIFSLPTTFVLALCINQASYYAARFVAHRNATFV